MASSSSVPNMDMDADKSLSPRNNDEPVMTMLNELSPSQMVFNIRVRVLRAWNRMSFRNEKGIYALEMIIVDEQGTRRQATCLKAYLRKFGPLLMEGSTVIIKNPTLGDNLASFKYVDCPYKICLYHDSDVLPCKDFLGDIYGFSFTPFSSILDRSFQNIQPIDVIGDVSVCYDVETFTNKSGKESKKRTMVLQDTEGNKIYVTLWDVYVDQFNEYVANNPEVNRLTVIVQLGKLTWWKEKAYVSNLYTVTKLFINYKGKEIERFVISTQPEESSAGSEQTSSSIFYSIRDDFLVNTHFKKIVEVSDITQCNFKVVLKKPLIDLKVGEPKTWICNTYKCADQVISAVQRFKIPLRVQDSTGMITLTLFDKDAFKIFT